MSKEKSHICDWSIPDMGQLGEIRDSEAMEPRKITIVCKICNRGIDYVPVWDISDAINKTMESWRGIYK